MSKQLKKVSVKDILSSIKNKNLMQIILLYGEESFDKEVITQTIKKIYLNPDFASLDSQQIDFDTAKLLSDDEYRAIFNQSPFISEKRIVILKNSKWFRNLEELKKKMRILDNLPQDVCLIFQETKFEDKYLKKLEELQTTNICVVECANNTKQDLTLFVKKILNNNNLVMQDFLIENLLMRCDYKKLLLYNELKKIILTAEALQIKEINLQFLNSVAIPDLQTNIFDFTNEMINKNYSQAYQIISKLEIKGEEAPLLLLNLFSRHIKQLIILKTYDKKKDIFSYLKLPRFVLDKLAKQSSYLNLHQLFALYELFYNFDVAFKKGILNQESFLPLLIAHCQEIML